MGPRRDSDHLQSLARFAGQLIEGFAGQALDDAALREIAPRVVAALSGSLAIDGAFVALLHRNAPPTVISQTSWPEPNPRYAEGPYLLDPFYEVFLKRREGGCFRLGELVSRGFTRTEYFRSYYRHLDLNDEIGYVLPLDGESAAHVSLARSLSLPRFTRREHAWLIAAQPIAEALMRRLWLSQTDRLAAAAAERSSLHHSLNGALARFGSSVLTEREAEVMQLLLRGNTVKAIARPLDIAPGTVRNHLKQIYRKLGVTSQGQLFNLFFQSLERVGGDPAEKTAGPSL
jgi:DNA-binding CsgD family transcriptional regulator